MAKNDTRDPAPPRKRRRLIYINERDIAALTWVGQQLAVNYVHLQHLLGRLSPQPQRLMEPAKLSIHTVRQIAERWELEGLVKVRKFTQGQPHWVWLTARGLRQFGLPYSYVEPKLVLLNHYSAVNNVRLYLERTHGEALQWRCERDIIQEHLRKVERNEEPAARHLPDAEINFKGHVQAIEVELTQKSRERLGAILAELRTRYKLVIYLAADRCLAAVESAVADIQPKDRKKGEPLIEVRRLVDYQP